jgi:hypothetical protein
VLVSAAKGLRCKFVKATHQTWTFWHHPGVGSWLPRDEKLPEFQVIVEVLDLRFRYCRWFPDSLADIQTLILVNAAKALRCRFVKASHQTWIV